MKDVTTIFREALNQADDYSAILTSKEVEKLPNIWCRLEDDSNFNWYLISQSNGKSVTQYYGYLSAKFPIALLMEECPHNVYNIFYDRNIIIDKFIENIYCSPEVLSKYIANQDIALIDDRFLKDSAIPFDEELFLKIDEGIHYINPYDFLFDDIK